MFLNLTSLLSTCAPSRCAVSEQGRGCRRLSSVVADDRPRTAHRRPGSEPPRPLTQGAICRRGGRYSSPDQGLYHPAS